jgi:hypothetical protein
MNTETNDSLYSIEEIDGSRYLTVKGLRVGTVFYNSLNDVNEIWIDKIPTRHLYRKYNSICIPNINWSKFGITNILINYADFTITLNEEFIELMLKYYDFVIDFNNEKQLLIPIYFMKNGVTLATIKSFKSVVSNKTKYKLLRNRIKLVKKDNK